MICLRISHLPPVCSREKDDRVESFYDLIFIFENDIRDHLSFFRVCDGPIRKPGSTHEVKE